MTRQSITLTRPNDEWLKAQVESEEYASISPSALSTRRFGNPIDKRSS